MSDNEINKIKQNIKELQDQNAIDFQQWKRLGQEIKKLKQSIKTSDKNLTALMNKITHDYEKLRKVIVDENVQVMLNEKIEKNKTNINKKLDVETFLSEVETINTKIDKNVNTINVELSTKAKKRLIYYLSDFGMVNDENYDNTPAFKQALNELQKTGGKLIIDTGTWEFKTPCIIDDWFFGCEIEGMSRGILNNETNNNAKLGNFGSILNYSGTGCLFTFNGKLNHCKISNLRVLLSDSSEFMKFNYTFHRGIINQITVQGGKGCLDFNTGTYVRIENFAYNSSNQYAEYGIRIGNSTTRYTTEFFYINNSSIDFGNLSSANCIDIYRMEGGLYIDNTDLCNTNGTGLRIENMLGGSSNYFVIRDVNFTRNFIGIELYAKTGNIGGVFIDNVRYGLKCASVDERIIKCYGESGKNVMIHHKNAYVRTYAKVFPTYVAELLKMDSQSVFEINAGNSITSGFNSPIKIGTDINKIYDYRIQYKGSKNLTLSTLTPSGTGTNWKDYKIELTSLYPYFYETPLVIVNYNHAFTNGVIKTEITNNVLYVYVRIGNDVPSDNIRMNYQILN